MMKQNLMRTALISILGGLLFSALADGKLVYHIGNSHTSYVKNGLMGLAVGAGHDEHNYGKATIPGAPLRWIVNHNEDYKTALPGIAWDVLTLQSYNSTNQEEIDAATTFTELAREGNPDCRVLMYSIWPSLDDDWVNPSLGRREEWNENVSDSLAARFPGIDVGIIPGSAIIRELGEMADNGMLPGVVNKAMLFHDGGHLSHIGSYAINVAFCSIIYNESPFDYPTQTMKSRGNTDANHALSDEIYLDLPDSLADVIKRTVWDIVTTYSRTGIDAGFLISSRKLPVAVVDVAYEMSFSSLNEKGAVTWSIEQGTLPQGLSLSQDGMVSGTPTQTGNTEITILASDGTAEARRTYTMRVAVNVPPEITTANLPSTALDEFVLFPFGATGGVGTKTWEVVSGEIPYGLQLAPHGTLLGNPGEHGEFTFTIRVQDSNPQGVQSDEKQFVWDIGAPSTETARIKMLPEDEAFELDGIPNEPFWDMRHEVGTVVSGEPGISAVWDAVWTEDGKNMYVAIEVFDGPAGADSAGHVDIYLDSRNNKELIYNRDDSHWRVTRAGKRSAINGGHIGTSAYTAETDEGYTVEMRISRGKFVGNGATTEFGAKGVYGFDIGATEITGDSTKNTKLWQGNAENDENTAGWGTIWLVTEGMTAAREPFDSRSTVPTGKVPSIRIGSNAVYIERYSGPTPDAVFRLFDCSGRLLTAQRVDRSLSIPLPRAPGAYFYEFSGNGTRVADMILRVNN